MLNFKDIKPEILGQSQKGQDAHISKILTEIGEGNKFYVEFGAYDGVINSNSWYLREKKGWRGLLLEGGMSNPAINLHDEFLTAENICSIFEKYNVPPEIDFLSIDIDGNDHKLLGKILESYKVRLVMVETCVRFEPEVSIVQKYNPNWCWDGRTVYGSTPLAFVKMAAKYNMSPVGLYLDDLFLVNNDYLADEEKDVDFSKIYSKSNAELYASHGNCSFYPENFEKYE